MKNIIPRILGIVALLAASASAQTAAGFDEANTIVTGASALVDAVIPIAATVVAVGIAFSLVKLVKRK